MYNWSFTPVEARADNDRSRVYLSHIPSMFTPGLAIFFLATILRPNHVRGVQQSRVWRKSRFLEHSIGRPFFELAPLALLLRPFRTFTVHVHVYNLLREIFRGLYSCIRRNLNHTSIFYCRRGLEKLFLVQTPETLIMHQRKPKQGK